MSQDNTYKYSEIFFSLQGEGHYTGIPTAWIRFFLCNLQCDGFGQKDPTDPSTYELPYQTIDISDITRIEDLPVFDYGCDSSYTWSKRYRHLAHDDTALDIVANIRDVMAHLSNPTGSFTHPATGQDTHMAFTGGEPMLNQDAILAILRQFVEEQNLPNYVTVETNGTRKVKNSEFSEFIDHKYGEGTGREWFWSCSPKLWTTAGEKSSKAIKPDIVAQYASLSDNGQLKFVVNGTDASWKELETHIASFREAGVTWPIWIMPVGATKEQQEEDQVAEIATEAMKRGYNVSGRLHCYIFGNQIGT